MSLKAAECGLMLPFSLHCVAKFGGDMWSAPYLQQAGGDSSRRCQTSDDRTYGHAYSLLPVVSNTLGAEAPPDRAHDLQDPGLSHLAQRGKWGRTRKERGPRGGNVTWGALVVSTRLPTAHPRSAVAPEPVLIKSGSERTCPARAPLGAATGGRERSRPGTQQGGGGQGSSEPRDRRRRKSWGVEEGIGD
eukprot:2625337-Pyramimonas_sp.AAC.1